MLLVGGGRHTAILLLGLSLLLCHVHTASPVEAHGGGGEGLVEGHERSTKQHAASATGKPRVAGAGKCHSGTIVALCLTTKPFGAGIGLQGFGEGASERNRRSKQVNV